MLGAVWVKGLPAFWPDNEVVPLFTSRSVLVVLMYFPGGFIQIANAARDGLVGLIDVVGLTPDTESCRPHQPLCAGRTRQDVPETTVASATCGWPSVAIWPSPG